MISTGQIKSRTLAWKANMDTWTKAGDVDELKMLFYVHSVQLPFHTNEGKNKREKGKNNGYIWYNWKNCGFKACW
jgi:hypothetical protein